MDSHTQKHKREKETHTQRNTRTQMQCFVCITSACLRKSLDPVGISREKSYDNRRLSGKGNNFSFFFSTVLFIWLRCTTPISMSMASVARQHPYSAIFSSIKQVNCTYILQSTVYIVYQIWVDQAAFEKSTQTNIG